MMTRKVRITAKQIGALCLVVLLIFINSFMVNFIWESLHGVFLYEDHDLNAMKYVQMVSYVSLIDGFLILGIYLFVAALWRDVTWIQKMNVKQIYTVLIAGLLLAAAIEYRKVFVTRTWSYNKSMPTFFGLGLSPLLQLGMTGLWAFWLSGRVLYQREKPKEEREVNSEFIERLCKKGCVDGEHNNGRSA
jgi:hypothetical protein